MIRCGIALATVAFLTGCALPPRAQTLPATVGDSVQTPARTPGPFLYVGGNAGTISEYALGDAKPRHSIRGQADVIAMAFDSQGHLYASGGGISGGLVSVYDARSLTLRKSIALEDAFGLALDTAGYLFVANCSVIVEYPPGDAKIFHTYRQHLGAPCALAFDGSGNLYAPSGRRIAIFHPSAKPGYLEFLRSISKGVSAASALTFGPSGDLYVANCVSCVYSQPPRPDSVSVYLPGASSPSERIFSGIKGPEAIAVDAENRLYVANDPVAYGGHHPGWVSVYAANTTRPLRIIRHEVNRPSALVVDSAGNLYVANQADSSVAVFSPGGAQMLRRITDGVNYPMSLAIGPP